MISTRIGRLVRTRALSRCEYCRIHIDDEPYAFHVEHIIPRKHLGTSTLDNLAWSCHSCNLAKGTNIAGLIDGEIITLFNPRTQEWNRHFRWKGGKLVGRTKTGKVTVQVLNINYEQRVYLRTLLIKAGCFPPAS